MRYHSKLTNFTTGEKNRAQNCLTVSNIKLDDVFSDVFGKAATAITTRLLESSEPFDVTPYLTKGIKAPVEKIQAAVDGEMCAEQAEKLRNYRPDRKFCVKVGTHQLFRVKGFGANTA